MEVKRAKQRSDQLLEELDKNCTETWHHVERIYTGLSVLKTCNWMGKITGIKTPALKEVILK